MQIRCVWEMQCYVVIFPNINTVEPLLSDPLRVVTIRLDDRPENRKTKITGLTGVWSGSEDG